MSGFDKAMLDALRADGEKLAQLTGEDHGPHFPDAGQSMEEAAANNFGLTADDLDDDEDCPNCGGEGVVYCCFEEFACLDPEGGCDDCERRCDWCRK